MLPCYGHTEDQTLCSVSCLRHPSVGDVAFHSLCHTAKINHILCCSVTATLSLTSVPCFMLLVQLWVLLPFTSPQTLHLKSLCCDSHTKPHMLGIVSHAFANCVCDFARHSLLHRADLRGQRRLANSTMCLMFVPGFTPLMCFR